MTDIRGTTRRVSAAAPSVTRLPAAPAQVMGRDLGEADWWRVLDALLLVAAHPSGS